MMTTMMHCDLARRYGHAKLMNRQIEDAGMMMNLCSVQHTVQARYSLRSVLVRVNWLEGGRLLP